jgi:hypothetical protein
MTLKHLRWRFRQGFGIAAQPRDSTDNLCHDLGRQVSRYLIGTVASWKDTMDDEIGPAGFGRPGHRLLTLLRLHRRDVLAARVLRPVDQGLGW